MAEDARFGSLAASAHHVRKLLGASFSAEQQGPTALPELYDYNNRPSTQDLHLMCLEGRLTNSFFTTPVEKLTAKLTAARREPRLQEVLNRIPDPADRAFLRSCGGEGSYALMANMAILPYGTRSLTNSQFRALMCLRTGTPPGGHLVDPLDSLPMDTGAKCTRTLCKGNLRPSGTHNLDCQEAGVNGMRAALSTRHFTVNCALAKAVSFVGREQAITSTREPLMSTIWEPRLDAGGAENEGNKAYRGAVLIGA